jgi:hypothetical protein
MGTTYLHAVASLDGYIADERDDVGPLHDWYFNGDHSLVDDDHADVHGAPFRVSAASADYLRGMWSRQKVLVIGPMRRCSPGLRHEGSRSLPRVLHVRVG